MKKVYLLIITILLTLLLASCKVNEDPYFSVESGDFIYATNLITFHGEEGEVSIIGLSEQGKQKELLIFPDMIDGYKVVAIGAKFAFKNTGPIEITKAKKVYFCNLFQISDGLLSGFEYSANEENLIQVFMPSLNPHLGFTGYEINEYVKGFVNPKYISTAFPSDLEGMNLASANLVYYVGDEMPYFVDYVEDDTVTVIPPEPYKDGSTFDGWYRDAEYKEAWDFEKDIVPTYQLGYDEEGNEIYKETELYAKWIASQERI